MMTKKLNNITNGEKQNYIKITEDVKKIKRGQIGNKIKKKLKNYVKSVKDEDTTLVLKIWLIKKDDKICILINRVDKYVRMKF